MKSLYVWGPVLLVLGVSCAFGQVRAKQQQNRLQKRIATQARRGQVRLQTRFSVPAQVPPALRQSLNAVGHIRYSGTRVIESKNGVNRQRRTELVLTDGINSRIEFPEGSPQHGQVTVENASERQQYFPARNELLMSPAQRDEAMFRLAKMAANPNLNVSATGGGNVAGLATQLITLADKQGAVKQRLWIEPRSGMILKRELYDKLGAVQASFEFTQVNLNPIIRPGDFKIVPPKGVSIVTPESRIPQIVRRQGFQDVRLPAGTPYKLVGARVQKIAQADVFVQQYVGDGHRITLYQLKTAVDPSRLGKLAPAGVKVSSWQSKGSTFVLVGDLPQGELSGLARRLGG